jgi:hypothetical protein
MRLAHRSHGASLRAIRAATPARCPDGRPSSRIRARPPRGASPGDRRARAVLRAQHAESIVAATPLDPRSDHCTRREAWSSERDHGERHLGARNPLLRGSADLRQLLARRPLLHAGTPPAGPRTTGTRGVCSVRQRVVHRQRWWRSVALPERPERAPGEGTLAGDAAGPGQEPRVTRYTGCREASQRHHEDASETTLPPSPRGSGRSQRGCTVERSCSRIRVHARCARRKGTWLTWQGRPLPPEPPLDRARERRPMQVGEDSSAEGAGNRRSHVDRGVTRLDPGTRDERTHVVRAPVARASRAPERRSG